jgi:taurine dioxygenase
MQHSYGGDPEILTVKTTKDSAYTAGNGWHTDVTCDEIPPLGSMLYMKQTPAGGGGDTLYADMYLAYEMLSETMRGMLDDRVAVHDGAIPYIGNYNAAPAEGTTYAKNEHPIVTTHPETGKQVLFVNSSFTSHIKGMKSWESKALLSAPTGFIASTPRLYCRVEWQPNTLTFWDNRCTQHHAVWDYWPETRHGERVSILGTARPTA